MTPEQQAFTSEFRDIESWIVSHPKAGRTWLRYAVARALHHQYAVPESLELHVVTRKIRDDARRLRNKLRVLQRGLPACSVVACTHDASSVSPCGEISGIREGAAYQDLQIDVEKYRGSKVLFLVRDPRDVVVSCYFEMTTRGLVRYEGELRDFIRDPRYGVRKIIAFYEAFHAAAATLPGFMLVRYEDMRVEPVASLRRAIDFLAGPGFEQRHIEAAARDAAFDRMYARQLDHASPRLAPGDPNNPESFKVRRGKVGGYVDYLDASDAEYVEHALRECSLYPARTA